jgi:hypothetical protein
MSSQNKDKPYRDALRREIARAEQDDAPWKLDRIARRHLQRAADGDIQAMKELADRLWRFTPTMKRHETPETIWMKHKQNQGHLARFAGVSTLSKSHKPPRERDFNLSLVDGYVSSVSFHVFP